MKNFKLIDFIKSEKADIFKIDNNPPKHIIENINLLVLNVLDPARELLNKPIIISSGFRCLKLNLAVKGSKTSQHLTGEAADISCSDNSYLFSLIKNNLIFDQLIYETKDKYDSKGNKVGLISWIHVSYSKNKNKKQAFKMHNGIVV